MRSYTLSIALLALCLSAGSAVAQQLKAGDLLLSQAWSRATPGGAKVAGGYITIENKGATADKLLGGSSPAAGKVEVHEMAMDNGVMKMRPVSDGLPIPPGQSIKLAPGGYHIMLMELKAPLKKGGKVPVTLNFEKAGAVNVTLDVQDIGATGATSGQMDHGMPGAKQPMKMDHKM
jgi:hypothetical protein